MSSLPGVYSRECTARLQVSDDFYGSVVQCLQYSQGGVSPAMRAWFMSCVLPAVEASRVEGLQ